MENLQPASTSILHSLKTYIDSHVYGINGHGETGDTESPRDLVSDEFIQEMTDMAIPESEVSPTKTSYDWFNQPPLFGCVEDDFRRATDLLTWNAESYARCRSCHVKPTIANGNTHAEGVNGQSDGKGATSVGISSTKTEDRPDEIVRLAAGMILPAKASFSSVPAQPDYIPVHPDSLTVHPASQSMMFSGPPDHYLWSVGLPNDKVSVKILLSAPPVKLARSLFMEFTRLIGLLTGDSARLHQGLVIPGTKMLRFGMMMQRTTEDYEMKLMELEMSLCLNIELYRRKLEVVARNSAYKIAAPWFLTCIGAVLEPKADKRTEEEKERDKPLVKLLAMSEHPDNMKHIYDEIGKRREMVGMAIQTFEERVVSAETLKNDLLFRHDPKTKRKYVDSDDDSGSDFYI